MDSNNFKICSDVEVIIVPYKGQMCSQENPSQCLRLHFKPHDWLLLSVFFHSAFSVFMLICLRLEEQVVCIHSVMDRIKWILTVVSECEYSCNNEVYCDSLFSSNSWCMLFWPCLVCVCALLKESKTCQGERLASAVDDTLDEYLIALQHKNRWSVSTGCLGETVWISHWTWTPPPWHSVLPNWSTDWSFALHTEFVHKNVW